MSKFYSSRKQVALFIKGAIHVLRDVVPFVQFKKREKHTWRSVTFSKIVKPKASNFTKCNTPPWVFFAFVKLYKWHPIAKRPHIITTSMRIGRGEES